MGSVARQTSGLCVKWQFAIQRITPGMKYMIRCHLSTLMGRDKLRVTDVARLTGLNRSTIASLYRETATRVDLTSVDRLCQLFNCAVGELFEHKPNSGEGRQ